MSLRLWGWLCLWVHVSGQFVPGPSLQRLLPMLGWPLKVHVPMNSVYMAPMRTCIGTTLRPQYILVGHMDLRRGLNQGSVTDLQSPDHLPQRLHSDSLRSLSMCCRGPLEIDLNISKLYNYGPYGIGHTVVTLTATIVERSKRAERHALNSILIKSFTGKASEALPKLSLPTPARQVPTYLLLLLLFLLFLFLLLQCSYY